MMIEKEKEKRKRDYMLSGYTFLDCEKKENRVRIKKRGEYFFFLFFSFWYVSFYINYFNAIS